MNTASVAAAIAARFTGVTAGGESIAVGPTHRLPNTIAKGPALLVFPPTGDLGIGGSRRRDDRLLFPVRLLRDPLDVPARSDALYAWYDALRDQVEKAVTLGGLVEYAEVVGMRAELDGYEYAGVPFDVVELMVAVRFNEVVATIAP